MQPLKNKIAIVAGGTRGAGRGYCCRTGCSRGNSVRIEVSEAN